MMRFFVLLICLSLCAGCATKVVDINPEFKDYHARKSKGKFSDTLNGKYCVSFVDGREQEVSNFKRISRSDVESWIISGLEASSKNRVSVQPKKINDGAINSGGGPVIYLEKSYVKHMATSISGVVVLSFKSGGFSKSFRGRSTKVNWWGAESEFENVLDLALADAIGAMWSDESVRDVLSQTDCTSPSTQARASLSP